MVALTRDMNSNYYDTSPVHHVPRHSAFFDITLVDKPTEDLSL